MAVTGFEPISGGSKPPILSLCTIPLWTTCGIRTPLRQCKCLVLANYTTRPIFVELTDSNRLLSGLSSLFHPVSICTQLALSPIFCGRGEIRTHLLRSPVRRFVDAGWFYRPVPLLSHNLYSYRESNPNPRTENPVA